MDKPGILFLCSANSARSVMAEAFCRRSLGDWFEVTSAGLEPKPVHPLTVRVMDEAGFDIGSREPHDVSEYLGKKSFRYVITVCKAAEENCPVLWPFTVQHLSWPFTDPAGVEGSDEDRLAAFRSVRNEIETRVSSWAAELKLSGALSFERS